MQWSPHVTVATVVEKDGRFLLVHEHSDDRQVYNQPAGHWEEHENLFEAALRETVEETGWRVELTHLLGVSQYFAPSNGFTYLRFTFQAKPVELIPSAKLDPDIIEAVWLTYDEIEQRTPMLRSPLVLGDIKRFLSGDKYPLSIIQTIG